MQTIPDEFRDLLERPIVVSLATVMPQGAPQVNPVWADLVDGKVRINTVTGRQKHRNLIDRRDVSVLVIDPENVMRWMEIRGELASTSEDDGIEVINKLSQDYTGVWPFPGLNDTDTRVTCLIAPKRVVTNVE